MAVPFDAGFTTSFPHKRPSHVHHQQTSSFAPLKKVGSLFDEFKAFAFKGNVVDLAIGVIIGAAFGAIIKSLVDNIIMPLVSIVLPSDQGYEKLQTVLASHVDPENASESSSTRQSTGENSWPKWSTS